MTSYMMSKLSINIMYFRKNFVTITQLSFCKTRLVLSYIFS